jgi:hypothetical protein
MKNRILILFFLFSLSSVQGQKENALDKTYYLLGTLNDYWSGHRTKQIETSWKDILTLHQNDSSKIRRIEEVTMLKFTQRERIGGCNNCHEFYELLSSKTQKTMNSYYDFIKRRGYYHDRKLKCGKILKANYEKQYSFLAGLFLVRGYKIDDVYKISLANSPWRYECTIEILKVLNSKIISTKRTEGTVPIGYIIEFEPSKELKPILDNEIEKRNIYANECTF